MNKTAVYLGIALLFIAQFYDIHLTFAQILLIILIATLGSIGTAGIPSAGLVMMTMVLTVIHFTFGRYRNHCRSGSLSRHVPYCNKCYGRWSAAVVINVSEKRGEQNVGNNLVEDSDFRFNKIKFIIFCFIK